MNSNSTKLCDNRNQVIKLYIVCQTSALTITLQKMLYMINSSKLLFCAFSFGCFLLFSIYFPNFGPVE